MRILLLILLIGGCASQPRPKVDVIKEKAEIRNERIVLGQRVLFDYLNEIYLRRGLIYMPTEEKE